MKHFTSTIALVAFSLLTSISAKAQYITAAPSGGFDVNGGKDYVVLYAPENVVANMGSKVIQNMNLDPDMIKNQFYYWNHNWAGAEKELQLCAVEETGGKNSWGGGDYLAMTPLDTWGGGGFCGKSQAYNLSKVTDEHILHIGLRNFGTANSKFKFDFGPLDKIKTNGFRLVANVDVGDDLVGMNSNYWYGVGELPMDGKWYSLEIPVSDLVDPDNFDFKYDWSSDFINSNGEPDHAFCVGFDEATVSQTTHTLLPGDEVYTYTITSLGTALALDGIFFYKKDTNTGIKDVQVTNSDEVQAVYDLSGRKTEMNRPGIYLVKTATGTKKVVVNK